MPLIIVLVLVLLTGCKHSSLSKTYSSEVKTQVQTANQIAGKNYEVYDISKYGKPQYQYFIFDNNHKILDYGIAERIEPTILITNDWIKLCISYGTGIRECRYYDVTNKTISDWIYTPFTESKKLVAYVDFREKSVDGKYFIVVQDIFNKNKFYREFKKDFSKSPTPIKSAQFINGDKQLKLTYLTGSDFKEVTETIELK